MARDFEYTFELAGNLAGSFTSSFRQANVTVLQSQQRIENLQNKLQQLDEDYQNGVISAKKYEAQKKRLNATLEKERNNLSQLQEELSLTNRIGSAFSEVITPYLSFGAALGAVSFGVHTLVTDLDSLQNSLRAVQSSTGATDAEMASMRDTMLDVYAGGFGTDFADIGAVMGNVRQVISQTGEELENASKGALIMRDTFGIEVNESVRAADSLMKHFGITAQQAYTLMAQGAQNGANKNGDLADSLNEYAVHFSQLGFSAEEFTGILINGAQTGAFSVDKVGDAMKEFGIRVREASDTTAEGFGFIGLDCDEMQAKFYQGGEAAQEAFRQTLEAILSCEDPVRRNTAGVDLLGTMWEDLGEKGVRELLNISEKADMTADTLNEIQINNLSSIGDVFTFIGRNIEVGLIGPLTNAALPVMKDFARFLVDNGEFIQSVALPAVAGLSAALLGMGAIAIAPMFITAITAVSGFIAAVGWIPLAIGAVIAAGVALYQNWDTISANISQIGANIGEAITEFFANAYAVIDNFINAVSSGISFVFSTILNLPNTIAYALGFMVGFFTTLPDIILNAVTAIASFLMNLPTISLNVGTAFVSTLSSWAGTAYSTAVTWMSELVVSVQSFLSNLPSICLSIGEQVISAVTNWASGAYNAVADWIGRIPDIVQNAIANAASAVSNFVSNVAGNFVSGYNAGRDIASNAEGGIYKKGAFLTTLAEEGDEAVVPLNKSPRAVSLWQQAGNMLGMFDEDNKQNAGILNRAGQYFNDTSTVNNTKQDVNITISPNININGNVDSSTTANISQEILSLLRRELPNILKDIQYDRNRVSFSS